MSIVQKLVGLISVLLSAIVPFNGQACDASKDHVIEIGAREDARPFIWRDEHTRQYLGFLWAICTEAVYRARFQYDAKPVTAETRRGFLETGEGDYDLLCDPTTITIERMRNFVDGGKASQLSFSPIVFVANSSFVEPGRGGTQKGRAGHVTAPRNSTCAGVLKKQADDEKKAEEEAKANDKAGAKKDSRIWYNRLLDNLTVTLRKPDISKEPNLDYQIWGYVDGTSIGDVLNQSYSKTDEKHICPRPFVNYRIAAEEFCMGRLSRFFGDVDIIQAALDDYRSQADVDCPADLSSIGKVAYEPYAFVLSSKHFPSFPQRFTLAIYGMFEDGTIERFFRGHFSDAQKSQYLSILFAINSIPAGVSSPVYHGLR